MELVKDLIKKSDEKVKFMIGGKSTKFIYNEFLKLRTPNDIIVTIGEGKFITPDIVLGNVKEKPIIQNDNKRVYNIDRNSIYFPKI